MLFRVGDVTAMIATVLFAIVPAIRYTNHGLRQIQPSLIEAAVVSGCTPWQTFWRVQLPLATPEIMLGINQTVLMALSMIVICAMIGTRDLGQEVFIALAKADAGRGLTAGLCIAFLGITADRLLRAVTGRMQSRLGRLAPDRHLRLRASSSAWRGDLCLPQVRGIHAPQARTSVAASRDRRCAH